MLVAEVQDNVGDALADGPEKASERETKKQRRVLVARLAHLLEHGLHVLQRLHRLLLLGQLQRLVGFPESALALLEVLGVLLDGQADLPLLGRRGLKAGRGRLDLGGDTAGLAEIALCAVVSTRLGA